MTHQPTPVLRCARGAAALLLLGAGAAIAQDLPATLIDRDLVERKVTLQAISSASLTYVDARGLVRTEPSEGYLAVIVDGVPAPIPGPWLQLADDQRFPGNIADGIVPDSVSWDHPVLGPMDFPLDQVRRISLTPARAPSEPHEPFDLDIALLSNGDRLEGFAESIGTSLVMSVDGALITTPLDRVADLALANPGQPPRGPRLWLADGSVLAVDSFESSRVGELVFGITVDSASDARARVLFSSLRAAAWSTDDLVPLAGIAPEHVEPIDRRWTRPPSPIDPDSAWLGASDIAIPGPMRVAWPLPEGTRRFACRAVLAPDAGRWGDVEFAVSAGGAELARVRINALEPEHTIRVELPPGAKELLVTLEPGAFGPVQDRVVLRRPMLAR